VDRAAETVLAQNWQPYSSVRGDERPHRKRWGVFVCVRLRVVRTTSAGNSRGCQSDLVLRDGRDDTTNFVSDGLYLIVVDALGQKQSKAIVVVR